MRTSAARAPERSGFAVDASTGWLGCARRVESPNCDDRPRGVRPDLLVVHGISLPPGEFGGPWIDALFTNTLPPDAHPYFAEVAALRVSAHALVRRDGEIVQYVPFHRRAWHAGQSRWAGRERCNDFSIGIELEGTDARPYEPAQYAALSHLVAALCRAYATLSPDHIVGHSDVAPGRKTDPGIAFDWPMLRTLVRYELEVAPA
ncbi:MAG: 1,6-anhydro-N-acetylmuramyl-L-alanine amidase AmpD [Gammaproteobacteria bacterium]|nr:1,6-anhydro-N-acetylmuramyl-L-alanine amidase AmpD [Gammaproteobacteria bacterium]